MLKLIRKRQFPQNHSKLTETNPELIKLQKNMRDYMKNLGHMQKTILQNSVNLNPSCGLLFIRISPNSPFSSDRWIYDPFLSIFVFRMLLRYTNPAKSISESLVEVFRRFCINNKRHSMRAEQGHALLSPTRRMGSENWCLGRQPFDNRELKKRTLATNGLIWDNRFKIRAQSPEFKFYIRPLLEKDWSAIKQNHSAFNIIRNVPHPLRCTVPIIVDANDLPVSLPSLGVKLRQSPRIFAQFLGNVETE